jgi:predicted kinase
MFVIMAGLPGTGKSTIARELKRQLPAVCFDKDEVRAVLSSPTDSDYSSQQNDVCIEVILLAAEYILAKDPSRHVILDGRPFSRRRDLERVTNWADGLGVKWLVIECVCSEANACERIERDSSMHPAHDRNIDLYRRVKESFEPIDMTRLTVDTDQGVDEFLRKCVEYVLHATPAI